jgi:hypothetical protein
MQADDVAPSMEPYEPALHAAHAPFPVAPKISEKVPRGQGVQLVDAV